MTGKIFRSIFIVAVSVLLAALLVIVGALYSHFSAAQETQLRAMLSLSAAGVEESGIDYIKSLDESCRVTWIDSDGTVRYDSERSAGELGNHAERDEIKEALETGEGSSIRYSDTLMQKTMYQAKRLSDGSILRVSFSVASVWLLVLGMLQPIAIVFLIALVLSIILAHKLSGHIMKPLEQLDLAHPLDGSNYEELTPLLKKLDYQQKEIAKQKQELADKRLSMEFAEENRREFTANVSHELKTPLQAIMGSAELIEHSMVKPEDLPRFAGNIRKESTRLLRLIEDIIHLSRLDENVPMEYSEVPVYTICQEEIRSLQSTAEQYKVDVRLMGDAFSIQGIPQLVREIVHNLLENAIKYNRPNGKVTIRLAVSENKKVLSVSDNGIGIPEAEIAHIFERFYRVDKSHSKETGGTGLGLSIVKHAVKYLNGKLTLESEPGVGTTISVLFES